MGTSLAVPAAATSKAHPPACSCDPDTLNSPWKADLCQVLHALDIETRRDLLDCFLLEHSLEIDRVLRRALHRSRMHHRDRPLALSFFGQALLYMVDTRWRAKSGRAATSPVFNYSRNLPAILEAETRYAIRQDRRKGLLDGTVGTPGAEAQDRRTSLVKRSRELYEVEYQRDPDPEQLVEFHNERMRATRKDPGRQAVLISLADLNPPPSVPLDDANTDCDSRFASTDVIDACAHDREKRLREVIRLCEQLDREADQSRTRSPRREPVRTAEVARVYFARHADGEFPSRTELVEHLGITEAAARRELGKRLSVVLDLAREAFADYREG